jgi:hypothetical protein
MKLRVRKVTTASNKTGIEVHFDWVVEIKAGKFDCFFNCFGGAAFKGSESGLSIVEGAPDSSDVQWYEARYGPLNI